jgi:hypothetical protein
MSAETLCTTLYRYPDGMDIERQLLDHEEQSAKMREVLRLGYNELIARLDDEIAAGATAGLFVAKIAAMKELGRLYQTHEKPGQAGKLTELQVSKLLEAERVQVRAQVLAEVKSMRQQALTSGAVGVREALIELSDKSLS